MKKFMDTLKKMNKEVFTKEEIEQIINIIEEDEIEAGNGVVLSPKKYEVKIDNKIQFFPKKEFKILHYLIANPNKCITRDAILRECWEHDVIVGDRTIDVHICKIKRKLNGRLNIYTQKGVGYKWKVQ